MSTALLAPVLSEHDPATRAEGAIDPLGLYPIADALAVRLIPGVRERQSRPRFVTAMAISLAVCSDFGPDAVAKDGVSEPWQAFEWYVVQGLVQTADDATDLARLPGHDKARRALRDRVPLSRPIKMTLTRHSVLKPMMPVRDGHLGSQDLDPALWSRAERAIE